jgi:hypothetical protein
MVQPNTQHRPKRYSVMFDEGGAQQRMLTTGCVWI